MFAALQQHDRSCNGTGVLDGFAGRGLAFTRPRELAETLRAVKSQWEAAVTQRQRLGVLLVGRRREVLVDSGSVNSVDSGSVNSGSSGLGARSRDGVSEAMTEKKGGWSSSRVMDYAFLSRGALDWDGDKRIPNYEYLHPGLAPMC